jgi:acyl-CoA:acyl-CoA alkyltransferase
MIRIKIADTSAYLPTRIVTNAEIEYKINTPQYMSNFGYATLANDRQPTAQIQERRILPSGALERLFGCKERRFAAENEQVSDIAAKAALPIVERIGRQNIDCMIFSAACSDVIEPATANIIQTKLGLKCPVFDLKNACNSFVTAIQVGSALIQTGQYKNVLIVNGEKLQDAIKFDINDSIELKKHLAAYTLGDAGAAMLLQRSTDESGIVYQKFKTRGENWEMCTVPGGGSLHPRGEFNYFEGKTSELRQIFITETRDVFDACFEESGWQISDLKHVFMHQVSVDTFDAVAQSFNIPRHLFIQSFPKYGNIAAATIPVNVHEAAAAGLIQKGDKLLFIGLGAGISIGLQLVIW